MVTKLRYFRTLSDLIKWAKENGYSVRACREAWTGPGHYYARGKNHISKHVPHLDKRRGGLIGRGPWRHVNDYYVVVRKLKREVKKTVKKVVRKTLAKKTIKKVVRKHPEKKVEVARAVVVKAVQRARKVKQLSPRVKQIADYLWDEIPRKYKEGKDRIWTYISVVALAKAIDEALGNRDWKSVDWAQEIDWASGYRNAKAVVHKILGVGGGFKGLTAREVEELVRKWNEVREELKLPESIDPWELKALFD